MKDSPAVNASRAFLDEVWNGSPPTLSKLIEVLDRLLVSYHDTLPVKAPDHDLDPPDSDFNTAYRKAGKRFPDLGLYPIADPTGEGAGALMMGDAIDDIADITMDLRTVVWYAENHSVEAAEAHFRFFYFHWGQHARELLLLLHRMHEYEASAS